MHYFLKTSDFSTSFLFPSSSIFLIIMYPLSTKYMQKFFKGSSLSWNCCRCFISSYHTMLSWGFGRCSSSFSPKRCFMEIRDAQTWAYPQELAYHRNSNTTITTSWFILSSIRLRFLQFHTVIWRKKMQLCLLHKGIINEKWKYLNGSCLNQCQIENFAHQLQVRK